MRYKGGYKIILRKNELKFFFDGADNGLKLDDQEQSWTTKSKMGRSFIHEPVRKQISKKSVYLSSCFTLLTIHKTKQSYKRCIYVHSIGMITKVTTWQANWSTTCHTTSSLRESRLSSNLSPPGKQIMRSYLV